MRSRIQSPDGARTTIVLFYARDRNNYAVKLSNIILQSIQNPMTLHHNFLSLDIITLSQHYQAGTLSPVEVIDVIYQRIAATADNPIWIALRQQEEVLKDAEKLEQISKKKGIESLPLFGIPFAVKDNIDVAGMPTTAACPGFSYVPPHHATAIQKLLDAGAIVIGKTNLDQFATGLVGTRSPYGICQNTFNSAYISGGSSSGSAVAVAAGLVSFALGTDTAGSGRVPAAFNNIIGLKPTRGLIGATGMVPACRSLDCVSIFSLTCDDAKQVWKIAQGFDASDGYSRHLIAKSFSNNFRFGVPALADLNFFEDEEYSQLYQQSLTRLEALGGTPVEIDFSPFREAAQLLYSGAWIVERYCALEDFFNNNFDQILPVTREIISNARNYSASDVFKGLYRLEELRQAANREWEKMDLLVLPTAGTIYKIEEVEANPIQLNTNLGYYTNFVNLLDLCAIALPAGFRRDGLPFGITLLTPAFYDEQLCKIGTIYHQSLGGKLGATPTMLG